MARTKGKPTADDYKTDTDDDGPASYPVKQEPCCDDPNCSRKRLPTQAPSPGEGHRRVSYDAAAVSREDARRAMKSARLAVNEAVRTLEHALLTAERAFDAEVDASNETRSALSKRRHNGDHASGRGQGEGGGYA
jgi:hypothetical protein